MEREADLKDYLQLFWKYRRLIFWVVSVSMALALLIIFLGPKMYSVNLFLKTGRTVEIGAKEPKIRLIENPGATVARLRTIYKLENNVSALLPAPIIHIKVKTFGKENLRKKTEKLKGDILKEHHKIYTVHYRNYIAYANVMEAKINMIKKEIAVLEQHRTGDKATSLRQINSEGKSILLERRDFLWELERKLAQYQNLFKEEIVRNSEFLNTPSEGKRDLRWPAVLLAMSLAIGVILVVILIFILEIRRQTKSMRITNQ